jgi:hypothetical protein
MGPKTTTDMSLPVGNSTSIPKLKDDASNWVDYKSKALIAMGSRGLMGHIEGQAVKPKMFNILYGVHMLPD